MNKKKQRNTEIQVDEPKKKNKKKRKQEKKKKKSKITSQRDVTDVIGSHDTRSTFLNASLRYFRHGVSQKPIAILVTVLVIITLLTGTIFCITALTLST